MRKVVSSGQPTIKEIAKRLNISVSTVSRALHDHHSIGLRTKARVQQLAAEMNYERNQTAIYFQQGKTFTIGILLPELSEAFFSSAISGIEDTAYSNNYTVLLGQSHDDEAREKQIIQSMKQHRVDGCIVSLGKNTRNYEHFEMLQQARIPVVFFDRIPDLPNIHAVSCNLESGTIQAVDFLLKKGHRVIGMINGPEQLMASKERATGYIKALGKHRLKYDPELIVNADLTVAGTESAMQYLLSLKRKVTAIVTFNDYVAMDAVQYALKQKLEINKDITFVSYANTPVSGYTAFPPAASVEQFPYEQGQAATHMLLSLLSGERPLNDYQNNRMESRLVIHNR
ncbi:LacI family DNA-binding transcriptional regulator [Chitinophaga nivalis]|uniref:LacI family transcriptional regulator n=1 Tax=Chitinophaga nivalis TaxID=2991709 RepID=A0ABT3IHW2_9BACT|nr:LacI family DNA-binding transcriptional regulator [Chitinophaga nivalis]MCW3466793.1 LacI family transcriptional regulator [Chitinophaga nivalis]MCW3483516.1 LacI family transcriptional regulator [Chitinophaga nivalis]